MAIPQSVINEINDKTSMVDIVSGYTTLKLSGGGYMGLCPFHSEKSPSFSVNEEKKLYYCFGCHKGGTLFQFVMEMESLNFVESVKYLGEKCGVEVPDDYSPAERDAVSALYELYERVSKSFHYLLTESRTGEVARNYLHERGFDHTSIENFQLGYAPGDGRWLYGFLRNKGYSDEFLKESGLFSRRDLHYSLFRDRLMIPIRSNQGRIIAFGGRLLSGEGPKYLNSPETAIFKKSRTLYGLNESAKSIRKEKMVYLCEGYMDVMALHQGGIGTAVAPLGTSFTSEQASLLRRYADTCCILFDSDEAGLNAAEKAVVLCARAGLESHVVSVKGAKDPAEILQKEGAEALQRSVKLYINSFDYLADRALSRHDAASPEGKHRIVTDLNAFLEAQDSEVKRDGYLRRLSDILEVNVTAISADLSQPTNDTHAGPSALQDPERIDSDLFLMLGAAAFPEYFTIIRQYLKADDLKDPRARELYILLEDAFRRDELEMNLVVQKVDNENIRALIFDKALSGELGPDPKEVLLDVLRHVRYAALERRQVLVARELKKAERDKLPHHELKELLSEKMYLTEELRKLRVKQG